MSVTSSPPPQVASGRDFLKTALGTRRRAFFASAALLSAHQFGEALVPVIIGATISQAIDGGSVRDIVTWLVILGLDFVFLSLSFRFGARINKRVQQTVQHRVRMWLTERVVGANRTPSQLPGDLLTRASSDAMRIGLSARDFARSIAGAAVLVFATVLLLRTSVLLAAVVVVGTVLLLVAERAIARLVTQRSATEQDHQSQAATLAHDLLSGLRVLKGIGATGPAAADYREASNRAVNASVHAMSAQATLAAVGSLLSGIYLVAIAALGGWLALSGHLSVGALISALGLARFLVEPMETVSEAANAYGRAVASADRVNQLLTAPTQSTVPYADRSPDASAGLSVDNLPLGDPGAGSTYVLTADFPTGCTGIACADPAVAERLLRVLAGEESPRGGIVHSAAVLVNYHDAALLPGTIQDNLAAIASGEAAIQRAVHASYLDEVIASTPDGAQTDVGEHGERLSGGQRQRVSLARALAAEPDVLVLHDPTTAVDSATEAKMAERVVALRRGLTTVIVTTSPTWLARCDQVVHLQESGCRTDRHEALLHADDYALAVTR